MSSANKPLDAPSKQSAAPRMSRRRKWATAAIYASFVAGLYFDLRYVDAANGQRSWLESGGSASPEMLADLSWWHVTLVTLLAAVLWWIVELRKEPLRPTLPPQNFEEWADPKKWAFDALSGESYPVIGVYPDSTLIDRTPHAERWLDFRMAEARAAISRWSVIIIGHMAGALGIYATLAPSQSAPGWYAAFAFITAAFVLAFTLNFLPSRSRLKMAARLVGPEPRPRPQAAPDHQPQGATESETI